MLIEEYCTLGHTLVRADDETKDRLKKTCFRGPQVLAGNFNSWRSVEDVFQNETIFQALLCAVKKALDRRGRERRTSSVCIDNGKPIGWSSTDHLDRYEPEDMERFELNSRSNALRIKTYRRDIPAPKTSLVTIVFELRPSRDTVLIIIHSIYPGRDVGDLQGDMSAREKYVWFEWNHPGSE